MTDPQPLELTVNGRRWRGAVEPRKLLADVLREDVGLTGTHLGCEHGVCGACTVLWDGEPARSCLAFAVQAQGAEITTVEGLAGSVEEMVPIQRAMWELHGLQCGFCTPGILMSIVAFLKDAHEPTREDIREALSGNLCRCTGYENIVRAVERVVSDGRDGAG
jgi:carbon-monoxide dehydrogenase small subunit